MSADVLHFYIPHELRLRVEAAARLEHVSVDYWLVKTLYRIFGAPAQPRKEEP